MERLLQDVRFAGRVLAKDRGFAVTAILTVAVCIGANAAMFAIVNSVLLQPLPVPDAAQLVYMYNAYPGAGVDDGRGSTGVPDYYDRLRETDVFQEQALFNTRGVTLGTERNPQRIRSMLSTPSLLRLLQVQPVRGRLFTEEDGQEGNTRKAVLTFGAWQAWFGGADDAVGRDVRINGEPYTVAGVLPRSFSFLDPEVLVWLPLAFSAEEKSDESRHSNNWSYLARLKPGASVEQARQQIDALNARNLDRFPALKQILINARFQTAVVPFHDYLVRDVRATLFLLWGGAAFVLLIGVVNVTNLTLVRSSARVKELATRHALGAGLGRLARQLLTESVILTLAGGVLGLAVAYASVQALAAFALDETPQGTRIGVDAATVAFTFGAAVVVGLLVGLLPVLGMRGVNLGQAVREEGRTGTAGRSARLIRRTLVSAQVAFAFVLLAGAGLLLASFQRVLSVEPGFNPRGVITGVVSPPATRYADDAALNSFWQRLLPAVRTLPGIQSAAATSHLPLAGSYSDSVILAEGHTMAPGESLISPFQAAVSPGYFETMGIALKRGRLFTESDTDRSPRVIIVDERLAQKFWPEEDPVGRRMWQPNSSEELSRGPGPESRYYLVAGVVSDIRVTGLTEKPPVGMYYFPLAQSARRNVTLVARTSGEPTAQTQAIRQQVAAIDPELPFFGVRTMADRVEESLVSRRTTMLLALAFGGVALFLAAVGIYGVLAFQVSQRRKELGIRLALGSTAGGVFKLVIREGIALLAVGFFVGLLGAFAIRTVIESQLYDVAAMDPLVLASVAAVLGFVALVACAVPARRAARIDPIVALSDQ